MTHPDMPPPAKRRWTRWVLIGSLAMNVLVVGLVIGAAFRQPFQLPQTLHSNGGMRALVRAMPDEARGALRDRARDRKEYSAALRKQSRELGRELVEALRAEPFDMAAVRSLFDRQSAIVNDLTQRGHVLVLESIEQMTDEERRKFANRLSDKGRRRR